MNRGIFTRFKVAKCRAEFKVGRVFDVEQDAENGLRGTRVVDDLLCEKDAVQAIVGDDRPSGLIVLHPFEQEDEAVNWSEREGGFALFSLWIFSGEINPTHCNWANSSLSKLHNSSTCRPVTPALK